MMEDNNQEFGNESPRSKDDVFGDRLWDELGQAKFNEEYLKIFIADRKEMNDQIKYGYLVLSVIGLCLKNYATGSFIILILLTIISMYEIVYKNIFPEKSSIGSLNTAFTFYNNYFVELEFLWWEYQTDKQDCDYCIKNFWEIKKTESSINKIINDTLSKPEIDIQEKAEKLAGQFLNKYCNFSNSTP